MLREKDKVIYKGGINFSKSDSSELKINSIYTINKFDSFGEFISLNEIPDRWFRIKNEINCAHYLFESIKEQRRKKLKIIGNE
jgi:hypothetical protein